MRPRRRNLWAHEQAHHLPQRGVAWVAASPTASRRRVDLRHIASGWVGLDANFTTSREMGPFRAFEHGLTMGRMLVRASWLWPALLGMSLVPLSLSFLISTWVKRPLFAGMLSVAGYWVLAMVLGAGTGAIGVDPMILLRPLFLEPIDTRALLVGAGLVGGVSLLLFFLALRRFRLREAR